MRHDVETLSNTSLAPPSTCYGSRGQVRTDKPSNVSCFGASWNGQSKPEPHLAHPLKRPHNWHAATPRNPPEKRAAEGGRKVGQTPSRGKRVSTF